MDALTYGFLGGAICGACLVGFLWMCAEQRRARKIIITRVKTFAPERPAWYCLGPCESVQHGPRPEDGLCFTCRLWEQEAGVPA